MTITVDSPAHIETLLAALIKYATDRLAEAGWTCRRINRSEYEWTGPKASPDHSENQVVYWRPREPAAGLLIAAYQARDALGEKNPLAALTAGMLLSSELAAVNEPEAMAHYISKEQRRRAKKTRRPRFPTKRVIRCALNSGCQTAAQVETYLETTAEVCDKWGLMAITDDGEFFSVEDLDGPKNDSGEYPEGKVYKDRLTVLVSQVKNQK